MNLKLQQFLSNRLPRGKRILPFLQWISELRDRKVLHADIIAGITVALVLVP